MIEIPKKYYADRLEKLRALLDSHKLDCLLIYNAENEDPAFLPWVLGNDIFDTTYLLINKKEAVLFIPQWFVEAAGRSFDKIPVKIIGTPEKAVMLPTILSFIKESKSIGYVGNAPYKELILINDKQLINVEALVRAVYEKKDDLEIKIMAKVNNFTRDFLDKLDVARFVDHSEKDLENYIREEIGKSDYVIGHLSIVAGSRLKKTTAEFPTEYVIMADDAVCIDLGVNIQTYYSDITRCYFLGESGPKYSMAYKQLQDVIFVSASRIFAGTKSKEVGEILKEEFNKSGLGGELILADFGHGIGTGRHEYPEIGFDDSTLEKGTTFTLEPEVRLADGLLIRYEDVFYIDKNSKASLCK